MSAEEFSGVTLGLGVVRGVRSFDVDTYGRLTGISYKTAWKPGENEAQCLLDPYQLAARSISTAMAAIYPNAGYYTTSGTVTVVGGRGGGSPKPIIQTPEPPKPKEEPKHTLDNCSCGFYAYYDGSNDYKSDARISAVVEGYGETLIGTRGFRAQKARIVGLCIPASGGIRWRFNLSSVVWAAFAVLIGIGGALGFAFGHQGQGWVLSVASVVYAGIAVLNLRSHSRRSNDATGPVSPDLLAKVRRNYPDVPMFTSFKTMVAAFPPDKGLEPSPETDPKFWER